MSDILIKAFECGVDYGFLLAEQERDSEDVYDACQCSVFAKKMCMPSTTAQRRQPHSKAWREAMLKSVAKFIELCKEDNTND